MPCRSARAAALQRMLEEHTYFAVLYWLWVEPEISGVFVPRMIETFGLSWPLRSIVQHSVRKEMRHNLHGQARLQFVGSLLIYLKTFPTTLPSHDAVLHAVYDERYTPCFLHTLT